MVLYIRSNWFFYTDYAKHVKIKVIDQFTCNNSNKTYEVISIQDSYVISNLIRQRTLSHPYNYVENNTLTYVADISQRWEEIVC